MVDEDLSIRKSIDPAKYTWLEAKQFLRNPPAGYKISDWKFFNKLIGGLREKEFTILCGSTGTGKTSFLANISANLVLQNVKHLVASVETGDIDFLLRVASVIVEKDLTIGERFEEKEVQEINDSLNPFFGPDSKTNLYLSNIDNRMTVEFLCAKLQRASEMGCRVAMLDNLNFFLEVRSAQNSIIEMDRVVHELIMLVKRIDMHVLMVMHPKKTENGRVESEFDIKGSSTAVQEAQNVFLFNRLKKEKLESNLMYGKHHRELTLAKMRRRGKFVGKSIIFDGSTPCYREVEIVD